MRRIESLHYYYCMDRTKRKENMQRTCLVRILNVGMSSCAVNLLTYFLFTISNNIRENSSRWKHINYYIGISLVKWFILLRHVSLGFMIFCVEFQCLNLCSEYLVGYILFLLINWSLAIEFIRINNFGI